MNIVNKFFTLKFFEYLKERLLDIALNNEKPYLTALALSFFTITLKKDNDNKKNHKKILFINQKIFIFDVNQLNKSSDEIIYLKIAKKPVRKVYYHFLGDLNLNDYTYEIKIKQNKEKQKKLYDFWKKVIIYWQKICKFDAIISGNFVYAFQTELVKASIDNNIPFFVLYKEGLFPDFQLKNLINNVYYNGKVQFYGTKMFIYNERIYKLFSNLKWLDKSKIMITGVPRIDNLFQNLKRKSTVKKEENMITLFFSHPQDKFNLFEDSIVNNVIEKINQFYINFIKLSNKFKDFKFIIRTKGNTPRISYLYDLVADNKLVLDKNLEITGTLNPQFLIANSKIVLSFASTVLLEALVFKKVICEPDLRSVLPQGWSYFDKYEGIINYISTMEEMEKVILNYEKYKPSEKLRVKALREYIYNVEGNVSEKVTQEMILEINKQRY